MRMIMKRILLLTFLVLIFAFPAAASQEKTGSVKLLAMSELEEGVYRGSVADLTLEIIPGKGRVFVNTFPISKLDTQISMRFAKQIACRHAEADCSRYDFIYTIKAQSSIVGGPSAGAAASVLTSSLLSGDDIDEETAITGTINSGELIGPVGGIKAKIEAASGSGIKTVLIPRGSIEKDNETNLTSHAEDNGVEIVEVANLEEALSYFTGKEYIKDEARLFVDEQYQRIMRSLAVDLCERSRILQEEYLNSEFNANATRIAQREESAVNETLRADEAFRANDYYTAASYCFRANINYHTIIYQSRNLSEEQLINISRELDDEIGQVEDNISSKDIDTITDMQAYMITKERISEADERNMLAMDNINDTETASYLLAFSAERLYSVKSWSSFFGTEGQDFIINNEALKESCSIKISEAEERYQYVNFYFEDILEDTKDEIDEAKSEMKKEDYIMCLFKASRAKAQANMVLGVIGVSELMLNETLSLKIDAAEKMIIEQQKNDIFPIMGYSYFEYANSLKEEDVSSGLIYAEYALELSNFDFYFEKKMYHLLYLDYEIVAVLAVGICIGYLASFLVRKKEEHPKKLKKLSAGSKR